MPTLSIVAINAKNIIKAQGRKQYAVGESAGYSTSKFSAMLNGRKTITVYDVIRLANTLNVTPNVLFGLEPYDKASQAS